MEPEMAPERPVEMWLSDEANCAVRAVNTLRCPYNWDGVRVILDDPYYKAGAIGARLFATEEEARADALLRCTNMIRLYERRRDALLER